VSRRTQVVRTADQGGVGNPRFLGGTEVLCSTADCGQINATDPTVITSIPVGASSDYRRCLVAATVGNIAAYKPTASPSYPRTVAFSRLDSPPADWDFPNLFPSESPHYSITESDGDNRLDRVSWYGRHRARAKAGSLNFGSTTPSSTRFTRRRFPVKPTMSSQ
jgi:hypothetical protein